MISKKLLKELITVILTFLKDKMTFFLKVLPLPLKGLTDSKVLGISFDFSLLQLNYV